MTRNNDAGHIMSGNWNDGNLNPFQSNNWRASLVPAAAVIPAPIAYIKVVAVKKLVVVFLLEAPGPLFLKYAPGFKWFQHLPRLYVIFWKWRI